VAIALLAGVSILTFKEMLNPNILFRKEIEGFTTAPIIGEIAYDKTKEPIVVADGKRNVVAEQFRQLRTSLSYIGINSRHKKILVTSTISGEGKSFISANLGVTLALAGKKVVLLELDLRKPKLSGIFKVKSAVGITNYLVGDVNVEDIIKETKVHNNLWIISSGPIPPNPSELIMNGKLNELLTYLESCFDYVIIDTAPVGPVTDAFIISPLCDATLYVVRHGATPKIAIKKLDSISKQGRLKNIAIVFNGVKSRGMGRYGYEYGYGYGNGYGYTESKSESSRSVFKKKDKIDHS
jgi:capsular exopolysaccharide synthesis family protein